MGGRGKATAEVGAEKAPGGQVAMVFQGTGDVTVVAFVIDQGGRVGIVHGFSSPVALQNCVETVGQRVMGLEPETRVWHVGRACEAEMPLPQAERPPAYQAHPWHEQITECTDMVFQDRHGPKDRLHKQKTTQVVDNLCCFSM